MGRHTAVLSAAVLACILHVSSGIKLNITVDKRLDGETLTETPATLNVTTDYYNLTVKFSAPYNSSGNNSVHLFLANVEDRVSELRFTPSGMILLMSWAPYNVLHQYTWNDSVTITTSSANSTWSGSARVSKDYLPRRIDRYNAAAVYTKLEGDELLYTALYSVTNYGVSLPDLLVLERYITTSSYFFDNNNSYSDLWST